MDANISSRINLMRILLISGIVFVHIPFGTSESPYLGSYGTLDWLRVFLGDSLFRVGVPCLSAISGYLLFRGGLEKFDYFKTLKSKAQTVLLPFLLWNFGFLALVLLVQRFGIGFGYFPDIAGATPREFASIGFAVEDWPINLPLYFLRDLLVCIVLSPILAFLVRRYPKATLLCLFAYAVLPVPGVIVLKKSILFSFCFGIYLSLNRVDLKSLDPYAGYLILAVFAAAIALTACLYTTGPAVPEWVEMLRNIVALSGILGSWALSEKLTNTRFGMRLAKGGGLSFWIFCAHFPVLILFWMIWNRAGLSHYPIFYFAAPILSFVILVASHGFTKRAMPRLYAVLTGTRGSKSSAARQHLAPATANSSQTEYSPQQR
ncbi:acyltransferase family protein [Ferirhizobium litorale]|uniref:Acyltransferase n=1 Tax=Ferirhizobium litorale TaxID=2927786 RepID=A0AAE3QGF4_9HYPH|nr:acyltransferase [Fererhizobium litorale]MDI7922668.1 acyltransferase [Fererhizobium litorale]